MLDNSTFTDYYWLGFSWIFKSSLTSPHALFPLFLRRTALVMNKFLANYCILLVILRLSGNSWYWNFTEKNSFTNFSLFLVLKKVLALIKQQPRSNSCIHNPVLSRAAVYPAIITSSATHTGSLTKYFTLFHHILDGQKKDMRPICQTASNYRPLFRRSLGHK